MKTFFEHVDERGQAAVCRELRLPKAIISRSVRVETGINEAVVARCEEVWGEGFDRDRTLADWYERWLARRSDDGAPPAHAQSVDGGQPDAA